MVVAAAASVVAAVVACVLIFWLDQRAWFVTRLVVWFVVTRAMVIVLAQLMMRKSQLAVACFQ